MSRSGYVDNCEGWDLIRWRGAVASAIRGKRGQKLLTELATALDAMPEKRLIAGELQTDGGDVCAFGSLAKFRGIETSKIDPYDREVVAATFDVAEALVAEIMYVNDERGSWRETPEARWQQVRKWVAAALSGGRE